MSEPVRAPRSGRAAELARVLTQCNQCVLAWAPAGSAPILRLESGAALIQGVRAQMALSVLQPLLALAAARLYVPPLEAHLAHTVIRPKVRVFLQRSGAGLLAAVRYFGQAPGDEWLRATYVDADTTAVAAGGGCALAACDHAGIHVQLPGVASALPPTLRALAHAPSDLMSGEVCLRAVWREPARRWPLVRVMAGRREVAIPMFSVEQAVSEDSLGDASLPTRSLAACLGEEASPSPRGRPALLKLRGRPTLAALRVEALIGHGTDVVHPVGPLLHSVPWVLGVVSGDDGAPPVLVLDPLALPAPDQEQEQSEHM